MVALSESGSDSDSAEEADPGTLRWQVVNGRNKRKREKPTVVPNPTVLPLHSPASPNLEPLVIVEEDPDPKVIRVRQDSDPDKG